LKLISELITTSWQDFKTINDFLEKIKPILFAEDEVDHGQSDLSIGVSTVNSLTGQVLNETEVEFRVVSKHLRVDFTLIVNVSARAASKTSPPNTKAPDDSSLGNSENNTSWHFIVLEKVASRVLKELRRIYFVFISDTKQMIISSMCLLASTFVIHFFDHHDRIAAWELHLLYFVGVACCFLEDNWLRLPLVAVTLPFLLPDIIFPFVRDFINLMLAIMVSFYDASLRRFRIIDEWIFVFVDFVFGA
jgi:hypothetical protein